MNFSDSDEDGDSASKQVKVVLLGNSATGKTSLTRRLCGDECPVQHEPTQGVEFRLKRTCLNVPANRGSPPTTLPVTAEIWDVAGDALDGGMIDQYIFGAQIVLLVFDIASTSSLEDLSEWLDRTRKVSAHMEQRPLIAVIGNKFDMEHERAVRYDRQLKFVHENSLTFHCVSAKTGENVEACFQKILADLFGVRLARSEQASLVNPGICSARIPAVEPAMAAVAVPTENQKVAASTTCSVQ